MFGGFAATRALLCAQKAVFLVKKQCSSIHWPICWETFTDTCGGLVVLLIVLCLWEGGGVCTTFVAKVFALIGGHFGRR